jgi:hypothetical protein
MHTGEDDRYQKLRVSMMQDTLYMSVRMCDDKRSLLGIGLSQVESYKNYSRKK